MKRTVMVILLMNLMILLYGHFVPEDFVPGLRELRDEDREFLNSLRELDLNDINSCREVPGSVDNSEHEWLRPVFSQDGGSCGQASGIGYCFTYEINRLRELSADVPENQYPDHYTWNYLNGGYGGGSWHFDGWQIVKASGCPTVETYGGMFVWGQSGWMDGYENYRSGMENRLSEIMNIDVSTEEDLEVLKHWFYDHGEDEETGGIVCFAAGVSDLEGQVLPDESPFAGEYIIVDWTLPVNHAMTFVGYNDTICFDYNGDGEFTNDVDINNDGVVNMRDWEIGAVKMVNSWGTGWANGGFCWVMYRTLAEPTETGGIWGNTVQCIDARAEYEPLLTMKTEISHNERNTIRIGAGVSSTPGAIEPEEELYFPHFNFQGGDWNLPGNNLPGAQPLEIGLDVTPLLSELEPDGEMKWWLIVESVDPDYLGEGSVVNYSFMDETGDEVVEFEGDQTNWGLINNWTNYLGVTGEIDFETVEIITEELPDAYEGTEYEYQLETCGGIEPFNWELKRNYNQHYFMDEFPEVEWQEIEVTDNDDGWAEIDLDFTFIFYNQNHNSVTFLTDGSLIFEEGFNYIRNEENLINQECIVGYGSDLAAYPEEGEGFYYYGTNEYAMFRWDVSLFGQQEFDAEFVIVLRQFDIMDFYYNTESITESSNWVAGVSRGDGVSYEIADCSGSINLPEGEATRFEVEPFPDGDLGISDSGYLQGTFWGVTNMHNPYQINVIVADSYGIYDQKVFDLMIYTMEETEDEITSLATLNQNYPNPFGGDTGSRGSMTNISYEIKTSGDVQLAIYNLKGQRVRTLVNRRQQAGKYQVSWEGKNDLGKAAGSGVYFYRLQNGGIDLSRKLLLIR